MALNTAAAPVKVFPADTKNQTKLIGDVTAAIIVSGNRLFPENDPVQWDWKQRGPICCLIILLGFFQFQDCQDEAGSLVLSNVSVEDSAKDAADVASSVEASFQSLKRYSLVVLLLLEFICRMLWHMKENLPFAFGGSNKALSSESDL